MREGGEYVGGGHLIKGQEARATLLSVLHILPLLTPPSLSDVNSYPYLVHGPLDLPLSDQDDAPLLGDVLRQYIMSMGSK